MQVSCTILPTDVGFILKLVAIVTCASPVNKYLSVTAKRSLGPIVSRRRREDFVIEGAIKLRKCSY